MTDDRDAIIQRLEFERDIYQRATNIGIQALSLISVYRTQHGSPENFLRLNGYSDHMLEMMKEGSESEWHYLRRLDYEVADISLRTLYDALRKLKEETA